MANRAIGLDRGSGAALHFLALSALHLRRGGELLAVLGHCQAIAGNAALLFNGVLRPLLDSRDLAEIEFALAAVPRNNACWIIAKYYRGCADIVRGDHAAALLHFTEFRRAVPAYGAAIDFMDGRSFNVMFRQGVTVGDGETVAKRLDGDFPEAHRPPPVEMVRRPHPGGADTVFFASCDGAYFEHFGRRFLEALAALPDPRPAHLHVIAPGEGIGERFEALAAEVALPLGFSVEPPGRYRTATYFACSRFFAAPALLEAYGRPLVSLDIDIAVNREIGRVLGIGPGFDFACFNTGRTEPASVYQASVMGFGDTPGGRDFVDALQRYCLPRLHEPDTLNWMLDQAALISVKSHFETSGRPLAFVELDRATGLTLADVNSPIGSDDEKQAMKHRVRCGQLPDAGDYVWAPD